MSHQPGNGNTHPLIALLAANAISQLGNVLSALAIPWFVLTTTGSATSTAITVAVGTVPVVIAGIFGGAFVDRFGYRPASIISDIASGISTMLIPLLHLTVGIAFWQLLVLVFIGALLDTPGGSARRSIFPDLAAIAGMQLERSNAIYSFTSRLATLIAAPLGGILIATISASNLLFFNAASFALSALIFAWWIPSTISQHRSSDSGDARGVRQYFREVREGFAIFTSDRLLFWVFVSFSTGSLLAEPLYAVILPVYVNDLYGSAENLGFIFAALAVGSLVGNLIYAMLSHRISRSVLLIGGFAFRSIAFIVFIAVPPWWVVAAAIFFGAVALEPVNPLWMTLMQERVPPGLRGRAFGVATAVGMGTFPIGIIVYGYLLDGLGLETTLTIFVIANLLVPTAMILNPTLRRLEEPDRLQAPESLHA